MDFNFMVPFAAALIPLVVGFIWYNQKTFGNAWMISAGLTEDQVKTNNMAKVFILCYIFSVMIAFFLAPVVIHQMGIFSTLQGLGVDKEGTEAYIYHQEFLAKYGNEFRTFRHGALHGAMTGFFLVLPVLGIIALFERRSFKYIAINVGYWVITLALMGGVLCQWI